ncbi:serine/threonine-protein kinase [Nocardiopsis nanhaiensis]
MNSSEADPGRILANRYRLDEVIGAGGMGRVWKGTDTLLDRPVAVKELTTPPNLPPHEVEVLRTRMLREARSAAQLSHPAIITVFDVAEEDGRPWIVMELVQGPSLGDLVRDHGAVPVRRAAHIGEQMAAALGEAHKHGIVHRDIKPGNVLIAGNDRAVLTDFGIAHLDGSTHLTSTGLLIGSPSYLAPEVAHGRSATAASDMWALGITLYQAVEGTLPFDRPTPMATLTAIVTQDLPETPKAGPLRPVLEALTEKRPEDRPTTEEVRSLLIGIRDSAGSAGTTAVSPALPATEPAPEPTGTEDAPDWNAVSSEGTVARAVSGAEPDPAEDTPAEPAGAVPGAPPSSEGARHTRGSRAGKRTLVVAAAALVLLVGAAATTLFVSMNRPGDDPDTGLAGSSEEQTADDTADEDEAAADEADEEPEEEEDDEWDFLDLYEDDSGYSLDVPEEWEVDPEGDMVYFRNPDGGYLLVDRTDNPNADAGDDWRDFEPVGSQNFGGYSLIGIEDVDSGWADDYVSAADWEFTFDGNDGEMHAINRGFHTEDIGYALFLVSGEPQGVNHALLDRIAESFEPAD